MGISSMASVVSANGRLFSIEDRSPTDNPFLPGFVEGIKLALAGGGLPMGAFGASAEVMAHLVHHLMAEGLDLFGAVRKAVKRLRGAYAIAVINAAPYPRFVS